MFLLFYIIEFESEIKFYATLYDFFDLVYSKRDFIIQYLQ